jgi:hypothetical protein
MECISLKRLSAEGLCGGLLYWEDMLRKALDMGRSLSIGAPMGKLEGIRLPGLLREKDSISGFLSWTQGTLRF